MIFPIIVAGAFFLILWNRNYVLYPPWEYGEQGPEGFVKAMHLKPGMPDAIAQKITEAQSDPADQEKRFTLIDTLIDEPVRQLLILMHEKQIDIPFSQTGIPFADFGGISYEIGNIKPGRYHQGGMDGRGLCDTLHGTGLVEIRPKAPPFI